MSQRNPETIRQDLLSIIEVLKKAEDVLQPIEQRRMAENLSEVYNYVSEQVDNPGGANYLRRLSAQSAKEEELKSIERTALKDLQAIYLLALNQHKAFVDHNFENAEKHFKTVQLAGYAVFFAVWGFTREWMSPFAEASAALLMMLSALIFVLWEIGKTSILASILKRNAGISSDGLDKFLIALSSHFKSKSNAISFFSRARFWVWLPCIILAFFAFGIVFIKIFIHLLEVAKF